MAARPEPPAPPLPADPTQRPGEAEAILNALGRHEVDAILGGAGVLVLRQQEVLERERQATLALRESERRLELAMQWSHMGAWDLDLRDHSAKRTPGHDRIFGYPALLPEWTYEMFLEHVLPEDRDEVDRRFREAVAAKANWSFECRIRRTDGEVRWIWASGGHQCDADGAAQCMAGIVQDITERKRTEQALQDSEARLRLAAEAAQFGIFDSDLEAGTNYWSPDMRRILGLPADHPAPPYDPVPSFIHPDDVGLVQAMLARVFDPSGDGRIDDTHRILRPDGEVRWVHLRGQAEVVGAGTERRVARIRGVMLDITERQEAAERLRLSEERFRLALRNAPVSVAVQDPDLRYIWAYNQRTARPEEIIGHVDADIFTPAEAAHFDAVKRRVLAEGVEHHEQRWVESPCGPLYLALYWEPVRDPDGRVTGVGSATVDLTPLKRVEQALRDVEERFQLASETGHSGTWDWDVVSGEVVWSRGHYEILGYRPGEVVPGYHAWFQRVHPDDQAWIDAEIARCMREHADYLAQFRVIWPDGSLHWVSARGRFDYGPDGTCLRMLGAMADVTELKLAELAVREADRRKDAFLATLAHELRNPLAPIRTAAAVLHRAGVPDAALRSARDIIERQVQHMARLVDDLLDVSRVTRGRLELRLAQVDLAAVLQRALEASRPHVEQGRHRLDIALPEDPIRLEADPVRLAQVFTNLINNACKYSDPGGHIRIQAERDGGEVVVRVADTGIGMAQEDLPGLFEMFTQVEAHKQHAQGGLGIGLALARGLVVMHGGAIAAHSEGPGRGSEFRVTLPVLTEPVPDQVPPAGPGAAPGAAPGRRVLVVDDNRDSADSLAMLLGLRGYQVETAHDGYAAVEAAARWRPDAVLLDIGLPLQDGYAACRQIRAQPWGADLVIVAMTGWGQEEDRRRSSAAGFDGHLVKPVDPDALLQWLALLPGARRFRDPEPRQSDPTQDPAGPAA